MNNTSVRLALITPGVVIMSFLGLGASAQLGHDTLYQVSSSTNAKIMKRAISADPIEDNKTYMAFDSKGAMFYFDFQDKSTYGYMIRQSGANVQKIDLTAAVKSVLPKSIPPNDTLFHAFGCLQIDNQDHIYAIFYAFDPYGPGKVHWKARIPVLVYSLDGGQTFSAALIPGDPDQAFLEGRTYATESNYPPLIGWAKPTRDVVSQMANRNVYGIIIPRIEGNSISLDKVVTITEQSPGVSVHTGGETFACTKGDFSYVAYNEIPPDKKGNNIWVAKVDRRDGRVEDKTMITNLPKPAFQDIHITPLVVVTKSGILHLITDGDGDAFLHFSADANHRHLDWKEVARIPGSDIYSDLIVDGSDRLHLLFTEWSHAPRACYTTFDPATQQWSKPLVLLTVPGEFSSRSKDNYGIYYYKACLDNHDNYYVSFSFWESYDHHLFPRKVLERSAGTGQWAVMPD